MLITWSSFVIFITDDKIEWNSSPTETNQSGPERRSAPPSKSTAFSLANMASMRSQSESPPHYQPLPLDEYIRPTSRQGPSLMTGPTHASKTPLRPSSRGVPDELLIETAVSPQWVPDYSDFVRRGEKFMHYLKVVLEVSL